MTVKWLLFVVVGVLLAAASEAEAKRRGGNCGLKCYRWRKCMGQLSGDESRPGQLGNTGQIVLTTCDSGECDCEAEEKKKEEEKAAKEKAELEKLQAPTRKTSSSSSTGAKSSRFSSRAKTSSSTQLRRRPLSRTGLVRFEGQSRDRSRSTLSKSVTEAKVEDDVTKDSPDDLLSIKPIKPQRNRIWRHRYY